MPIVDGVVPEIRHVLGCRLPTRVRTTEQARVAAILPRLRRFFGVPLAGIEGLQFLRYRRGHHYAPHADVEPETPLMASRRVTLTVALQAPDAYAGGNLVLYGVVPGAMWANVPTMMSVTPGTLVAFRSTTIHAVTPITRGTRLSVVTWAHAAS